MLRRHIPFAALSGCRRSRVPMQMTYRRWFSSPLKNSFWLRAVEIRQLSPTKQFFNRLLGVPFVSLRAFLMAQFSRSASPDRASYTQTLSQTPEFYSLTIRAECHAGEPVGMLRRCSG